MKTKLLFLLFSLILSLNINAIQYSNIREIEVKKRTVEEKKKTRSIDQFMISAYFDSDGSSVLIDSGDSFNVTHATVINLSNNEVIYSEYFSNSSNIILNLLGLLQEGENYIFEVTIGDTVFYGYFNL